MLKLFSKPAWQSKSAADRISALGKLSSSKQDEQTIILKLARQDPERKVRIAAIDRISELDTLADLLKNESDAAVTKHTKACIAQQLQSEHFADISHARQTANALPELQDIMACHCSNKEMRHELIDGMEDSKLLIALNGTPFKESKAYIVESLKNLDAIEQARKELRGKDKNAERLLKQKQDALRQLQQETESFEKDLTKAITEMQKLAQQEWRPELQLQCLSISQLWQRLSNSTIAKTQLSAENTRQYELAYAKVQATIAAAEAHGIAEKQLQSTLNELEALYNKSKVVDIEHAKEHQLSIAAAIADKKSQWQNACEVLAPSKEQAAQFENLQSTLLTWLNVASQVATAEDIGNIPLPEKVPSGIMLFEQIQSQQSEHSKQAQQQARDENKGYNTEVDQLHKKMGAIFSALRAGELRRAGGTFRRVEAQLPKLKQRDRDALRKRLDGAKEKLDELGDWKDFATSPKFGELCEQMEALKDQEQHPRDRAQAVRDLREQWKKLGNSETAQENWERFNTAAEIAYAPCEAYFENRALQQKGNLEKRQEILSELNELLAGHDWANPSLDTDQWKATQRQFQSLSSRWDNHRDVERKANKPFQDEFDSRRTEMLGHIEQEQQRNITLKEELIKRGEALTGQEASAQNLQQLKQLQFSWKMIGITPRDEDQTLWTQFKAVGDAVHGKVRAQRDGERNAENEKIDLVRASIKAIADLPAQGTDDSALTALQAEFNERLADIKHMPEKMLDRLNQDFRRAGEQLDEKRNNLADTQRQQELEKLRALATLCASIEAGNGSETVNDEWQEIGLKEPQWLKRIEARKAAAEANDTPSNEGTEQARRMVCIQLEIEKDIASPDEDRALRMNYQLEQLQNVGIGKQVIENSSELIEREVEWLCMAGAPSTSADMLDKRFYAALNNNGKIKG
jgi:hypothetical protein